MKSLQESPAGRSDEPANIPAKEGGTHVCPLVILADDLTGACDAAAPFADRGISTEVALWRNGLDSVPVQAFDLDLRNCARDQTYVRAFTAGADYRNAAVNLFAKIDSTLRGNVGEFLCGIQDGAQVPIIVVTPAFPRHGRTLAGGRLHVAGSAGELGTPDLLNAFTHLDREIIHVPDGQSYQQRVGAALAEPLAGKPRVVVVDAATDDHLAAIVRSARESSARLLMAGSGGLAESLCALATVEQIPRQSLPGRSGPIVVLSGSPAPPTRRQIDYLAQDPCVSVFCLPLDSEIEPVGSIIVLTTASEGERSDIERDDDKLSGQLALRAVRLAEAVQPRAAIMVGGSSSRAICLHLGVDAITMQGQAVGLPWGILRGGSWSGVPVITKSGRFGGPRLLAQAVQWLSIEGEQR